MWRKIWAVIAAVLATLLGVFIVRSRRGSDTRNGNYRTVVGELRRTRELVARERVSVKDERRHLDRERINLGESRDLLGRERKVDARLAELANEDRDLLQELRERHEQHNNPTAVRLDN